MPALPNNANETRLQISQRAASTLLKELDVKSTLLATTTRLLPKRGWSMADTAETKREQNTSIYKLKNVLGPQ